MFRSVLLFFLLLTLNCLTLAASDPLEMQPDPDLQSRLSTLLKASAFHQQILDKRFAVSLVDVTDLDHPKYAGVNDTVMMYAASLPKIAILLAGFEQVKAGKLSYTAEVRAMFNRIARFSSNADASKAAHLIGFENIASTLTSPRYMLYDPARNGGLWVGNAYGGPADSWRRDPLHNLSHGATTLQTARFFTMLAQERLVDAPTSRELKDVFSRPGIQHKFVKGLSGVPGLSIYRKSGTWKDWHADAALIEFGGRRYVAAALAEDRNGARMLEQLIGGLHRIICDTPQASPASN